MTPSLTLPSGSRVALCGNCGQDPYLPALEKFLYSLSSHGMIISLELSFGTYLLQEGLTLPPCTSLSEQLPGDARLIISIGGDGAFLRAAQWCGRAGIPILGVNTGHLGYLAGAAMEDAEPLLEELLAGSLMMEHRALLKLSGPLLPAEFWPYALNEVAIMKEDTSSMINIHTSLDGNYLADYLADGLVISTPTGSTAYNLSLGGPILQPTLDCIILTPSAPHTLTLCPMVVSADSRIECVPSSRADNYRLSLDGRSFVSSCGDHLIIEKADFHIVTLRRPGDNFSATLRHKLHWGSR